MSQARGLGGAIHGSAEKVAGGRGGHVEDAGQAGVLVVGMLSREGVDATGIRLLGQPKRVHQGTLAPVLQVEAFPAGLEMYAIGPLRVEHGLRKHADIRRGRARRRAVACPQAE